MLFFLYTQPLPTYNQEEHQTSRFYQTYLLFSILVILLLVHPVPAVGASDGRRSSLSSQSNLVMLKPLPDPELLGEPTVVTNGTSSEFSYSHSSSDNGYIDLVWSHTAGTELDFKSSGQEDLPDCNDFIYFKQSFSWPYKGLNSSHVGAPLFAVIDLDCEETVTGNFSARDDYWQFYSVFVWLINPSGDWIKIFGNHVWDNHSEIHVGSLQISRAWSDMIEGGNGTQLNPTNMLTLAVGLAPTFAFEKLDSWNPWQNMTGTVTAHVTSVYLNILGYFDVGVPGLLEPEYTGAFNDGFNCYSEGIAMGPDSTVYTVGRSSYYKSYTDYRAVLMLQKWDSKANLIWTSEWNDTSRGAAGYDVAVSSDGSIFVTGVAWNTGTDLESNHLLTKWNSDGQLLWNKTYDVKHEGYGRRLVVEQDGSVYTLGERRWTNSNGNLRITPVVVKWDSNGNVLWSQNCSTSGFDFAADLIIAPNGTVYSATWETILGFSPTGNVVLNSTGNGSPTYQCIALGPGGELYSVGLNADNVSLCVHGPNGERARAAFISRHRFNEFDYARLDLEPNTLRILDNGSVFLLCSVGEDSGYWTNSILYKFTQNLDSIWNRTLSMATWRLHSFSGNTAKSALCIGDSGLFYVTATNSSGDRYDFGLLVYNPGGVNPVPEYPVPLIALGAGVGVMLVVTLYIARRRRKQI